MVFTSQTTRRKHSKTKRAVEHFLIIENFIRSIVVTDWIYNKKDLS